MQGEYISVCLKSKVIGHYISALINETGFSTYKRIFRSHDQWKRWNCWHLKKISFDPFARKFPNLEQWMLPKSRWSRWYSVHMVKGQGQTAAMCTNAVRLISFDSCSWKLLNLVQWMSLEMDVTYWFSAHVIKNEGQKRSKNLILTDVYSLSFVWWLQCFKHWLTL